MRLCFYLVISASRQPHLPRSSLKLQKSHHSGHKNFSHMNSLPWFAILKISQVHLQSPENATCLCEHSYFFDFLVLTELSFHSFKRWNKLPIETHEKIQLLLSFCWNSKSYVCQQTHLVNQVEVSDITDFMLFWHQLLSQATSLTNNTVCSSGHNHTQHMTCCSLRLTGFERHTLCVNKLN